MPTIWISMRQPMLSHKIEMNTKRRGPIDSSRSPRCSFLFLSHINNLSKNMKKITRYIINKSINAPLFFFFNENKMPRGAGSNVEVTRRRGSISRGKLRGRRSTRSALKPVVLQPKSKLFSRRSILPLIPTCVESRPKKKHRMIITN